MQTRKRKIISRDIPFLVEIFLSEKAQIRTNAAVMCSKSRLYYLIRWIASRGYSINPNKWTRDHALAFRKDLLASGYKTAPDIYIQAKNFWRWMVLGEFAKSNPFDGIVSPPGRKQRDREPISEEEYRNLVAFVARERHGDQWACAFTVGYFTGMAISDCTQLRWREIDMDVPAIRRNRNKTDVRATIPFERGGELCARLDEMRAKFPPQDGESFVTPIIATIRNGSVFAKAREALGLPKEKTFHNFRATMASRLINGGVSSIVARRITGHQTLQVFDRYVRVEDAVLEKAVRDAGYISSAPKIGQEIAV